MNERSGRFSSACLILFVCLGMVFGCLESLSAELQDRNALSFLDSVVGLSVVARRLIIEDLSLYFLGSLILLLSVSSLGIFAGLRHKQWRYVLFLASSVGLVLGEYFTLTNRINFAVASYVVAVATFILFVLKTKERSHLEGKSTREGFFGPALVYLVFLTLVCLRFYAINRCPVHFDGEGCYFRLTQSDFYKIIGHEAGVTPQTSGGFLWHVVYYLIGHTNETALYHVCIRNLSASLGILKLLVFYLFLNSKFGRFEALLGLLILGFGPPENWWARQPFFHHLPGLVTILLVWSTINLVQNLRWRDFIATAILMFATRLLYPSGVFGFMIPLCCLSCLVLFDWKKTKAHLPKLVIPLGAAVLWALWLSIVSWSYWGGTWKFLPPFLVPSHAALPETLASKLYTVFVTNGHDLLTNIFLMFNDQSHWTYPLTIPPNRTATSLTLILAVVGVCRIFMFRAGRIGLVFFWWLVWGAAPALSTQIADRRLGSFHLALISIAVMEGGRLINFLRSQGHFKTDLLLRGVALPSYVALLAVFGAGELFEGRFGRPFAAIYGEEIRKHLSEGTLVVYSTPDIECEVFFGVYQNILQSQGKLGWVGVEGDFERIKSIITKPVFNPEAWTYRDTKQAEIFPDRDNLTRWSRYLFVLTPHPESGRILEFIRGKYPTARFWRAELKCNGGNDKCPIDFVEYSVKEP